ncbi:unnamed protein product [Cercopithifilaria johnstoni]|uniref:Uncharacterized protein n=1 Tax=Cercopithifilaria johnstoni TaxID=2874296 RepID=A0A8J2Q972_9BILA|nr:unnamed protein product [Cercopithifilaria johnstoni]
MCYAFNYSDEAGSFEDDDAISGNMILQGLIEMPSAITSTVEPTGKPEFVLALSIVLVIFVIILIISIFLLLYCVLKRQGGGRAERRKHDDYERRRQHRMRPKTIVTDLARKAKVSEIAASIEAAVKSAESSSQLPKPSKQTPSLTAPPQSSAVLPKPKSISKKLPRTIPHTQSETAVEAPSVFMNQTFVNRWHGPWQQIDYEPSDFSYELESDSINDDICLRPL